MLPHSGRTRHSTRVAIFRRGSFAPGRGSGCVVADGADQESSAARDALPAGTRPVCRNVVKPWHVCRANGFLAQPGAKSPRWSKSGDGCAPHLAGACRKKQAECQRAGRRCGCRWGGHSSVSKRMDRLSICPLFFAPHDRPIRSPSGYESNRIAVRLWASTALPMKELCILEEVNAPSN